MLAAIGLENVVVRDVAYEAFSGVPKEPTPVAVLLEATEIGAMSVGVS